MGLDYHQRWLTWCNLGEPHLVNPGQSELLTLSSAIQLTEVETIGALDETHPNIRPSSVIFDSYNKIS